MDMLSSTLEDYEEKYKGRYSNHEKDYFENDKTSFLELELSNYTKYYNSLKKVFHFTKTSPRNNLGHYPITSMVGLELEIINKPVFNEIISEIKADPEYDEDKFRRLLYPGKNAPSIEINIKVLNNRITSAKRILDFIKHKQESMVPGKAQKEDAYKDDYWFKVGFKLASGQMAKYYTIDSNGIMHLKNSYTAPIVAEELGDKNWQKDVLATLKNYGPENTNAHKNIFNSRDKMTKIIEHCKENGIPVIPHFKDRLPPE